MPKTPADDPAAQCGSVPLDTLLPDGIPTTAVRFREVAARAEYEFVLAEVPDRELLAFGEPGVVVLIARYDRRIRGMVRRWSASGADAGVDAGKVDDLRQAAHLGFLTAMRTYDANGGAEPFTYAFGFIRRELSETLRTGVGRPVPGTTRARRRAALDACQGDPAAAREWSAKQRLTGRGFDPATWDVLAAAEVPTNAPGALTVADHAASAAMRNVDDRDAVARLLGHLSDRDASIVRALFGIDGPQRSAAELAREHGVSAVRVRGILSASLKRLRLAAGPRPDSGAEHARAA